MPAVPASSTLIVSTYNWPEALELVLRSVLTQSQLPSQVVVADDGSAGGTRELLRDVAPAFQARGVPLVHVWQADAGFRKTRILNRALAASTGDYVLMVDGDCVLHPEFVRSHLRFARPGTFAAGSRVLLRPALTERVLGRGDPRIPLLGPGLKNRQNGLHLPWLSYAVRTSQDPLVGTRGCNIGVWRADAERVNGYNEAFVGWGREDSEFATRLMAAGVRRRKIKFRGVVFHLYHYQRPQAAVPEQQRMYEEAARSGATWCEQGIDRHRCGGAGEPTDETALL